jgi:thiamine pyrophosphate-dependent acetolactate synthase large subunit-like protein
MNGGKIIADVLKANGTEFLYTLCGGHISPIFVEAKKAGIRVIDVRDEATTVFAADATARLTGKPGIAAVTAGPGVTNTLTAIRNALMAQSPLILLGGATATVLRGRGALQDIDQQALMAPNVKWTTVVTKVSDLASTIQRAFYEAQNGIPGPVFVECPIDLLYPEMMVRDWYGLNKDPKDYPLMKKVEHYYLKYHLDSAFGKKDKWGEIAYKQQAQAPKHSKNNEEKVAEALNAAKRPLMIIGSQTMLQAQIAKAIAEAIEKIGVPVYLSGMARGLLGADHELQARHNRKVALREADLVLLAGVPCDFRMDYGRHISSKVKLISVNRSHEELYKNRKPQIAVHGEPGDFLIALAENKKLNKTKSIEWLEQLRKSDDSREVEITKKAEEKTEGINPVALFRELEKMLPEKTLLIADGGDFVATASYILHPRSPLSWLDPGVFGTLGVGGGFAAGAKLCRPDEETWIIYGDGSSAYTLAEFDTFARHKIPVIALIGNDASWAQIARDQVDFLGDSVATDLAFTDYHEVAKGYGGDGIKITELSQLPDAIAKAREANKQGKPFLINAILGKTDFRKGSISV